MVALALPALWVLGVVVWEVLLPAGTHCLALLAATPALACAVGAGGRSGVWLGGGCALLALYPLGTAPVYEGIGNRTGMSAAILSVAVVSCCTMRRRIGLAGELARTREVAHAAQQALIRPLPPRIEGFTVAAGYLSAARGAAVGGDLYDAVATEHGLRIVIGDVRGHGLGAVGTVAAVLGGFREAAHDEPRLERVPHRLERALDRHLTARRDAWAGSGDRPYAEGSPGEPGDLDEEFVTALLLEVRSDDTVVAVNCGHPWPYRLSTGGDGGCRAEPVSAAEPVPPLGMLPLPAGGPEPCRIQLPPGEALFLYTDGAEDARDSRGGCFPLPDALTAALAGCTSIRTPARVGGVPAPGAPAPACTADPVDIVGSMRRALLRHSGGRLTDDVAMLALRNDRGPGRGCDGSDGRGTGCRAHREAQPTGPLDADSRAEACSCL